MAENSKIQWTDATWNAIAGCSKISAGCKNCYAIKDAVRLAGNPNPKVSAKYAGTTEDGNWTGVVNLGSDEVLAQPLRWTNRRRIFVNSMSDLFHESVPDEWIDKIFAVMVLADWHQYQILTKRPERMKEYLSTDIGKLAERWADATYPMGLSAYFGRKSDMTTAANLVNNLTRHNFPLRNVWLGVSVENQKVAEERIPILLDTPASVRFISAEPLLGPLDLTRLSQPVTNATRYVDSRNALTGSTMGFIDFTKIPKEIKRGRGLDWVIVGGESGKQARPCSLEWIMSIVKQCTNANVPVFVKQVGGNLSDEDLDFASRFSGHSMMDKKGGNPDEWPPLLRVRQLPNEASK